MTTLLQKPPKPLIFMAGSLICSQFTVGAAILGLVWAGDALSATVTAPGTSKGVTVERVTSCKNRKKKDGTPWPCTLQTGGVSVASLDVGSLVANAKNQKEGSRLGQVVEYMKQNPESVKSLIYHETGKRNTLTARRDILSDKDYHDPVPLYGSGWYVGMFQQQWAGSGNHGPKILQDYSPGFLDGDAQTQVNYWMNEQTQAATYGSGWELFKAVREGRVIKVNGKDHKLDLADLLVCIQFQTGSCAAFLKGYDLKLKGNPSIFTYSDSIRKGAGIVNNPSKPVNAGVDGIQCMKGQQLPLPPVEEAHIAQGVDPNAPPADKDDPSYSQKCETLMSDDLSKRGASKLPKMPIAAMNSDPQYLISGRYGKLRPQGHYHNGLDFRARQGTTLYAADSGKVVLSGTGPVMGNQIAIRRNGTNDVIHYGHLSRRDVKLGDTVSAGDPIGLSGGEPGSAGAGRSTGAHLHFQYFVPPGERQDTLVFTREGTRVAKKGGYQMWFEGSNKVITTDPSPYLPIPVKMKDGDWQQLGDNTWHQYCVLRELTGKAGSFSDYSSMMDRIESQVDCNTGNDENGGEWSEWLPDDNGWGEPDAFLDMSPDGTQDHRSFLERALDVAAYRFGSEHWARKILYMSDRKLWLDYLLARRTQTWLEHHIALKRDMINMNLAVLLANAADESSTQAQTAAARADQRAKAN